MIECLTDDEVENVLRRGPFFLVERTDDKAHKHLFDENCLKCWARLHELILSRIIIEAPCGTVH